MSERVAIVAASVTTALGADLSATFRALMEGRGALAPVRGFDAAPFGDPVAAQLPEVDASIEADGPTRVTTPHGRLLDLEARRAHDDAHFGELPRDAIGFFTAMPVADSQPAALSAAVVASRSTSGELDLAAFFGTGFRSIHPLWPLEMLNNVSLGQAAADLDVRGDNSVFSSEADAGARAIAEAVGVIRRGELRAVLAVGVGEHVSLGSLARARLRALPGEVLGEGAGALALESEASAAARGRVATGYVGGTGFAFERSPLGPGPSSDAIVRAVRTALADAARSADEVALLVVEGIGAEEATARRELFGARGAKFAVMAPAVAIGHLQAGAAVVGAALAAAMLAVGRAPSTAHGRPRALNPDGIAVVLASGSGGQAAAVVIEGVR